MTPRRLSVTLAFATAFTLSPVGVRAQSDSHMALLEREIGRLASLTDGTVGVGAVHLEMGREAYLHGSVRFPMASTYKVPIAVQLLTLVDQGRLSLDSLIEIQPSDLHPGSGTLTELFDDPGVILSLRNLLELMLLISDNSATDLVLAAAGGPAAVTARMRDLGLDGITVNRPTVRLITDWLGIEETSAPAEWRPGRSAALREALTEEERDAAATRFDQDPRDTATPRDMAALLARLWRGELLSAESTALLLDIMGRSLTGERRIRGLLTPDAVVAHKTGTIGGTTNDAGIVTLPDDAGHVVTVVFVKESEQDVAEREEVIGHIARAVHDYFLFTRR